MKKVAIFTLLFAAITLFVACQKDGPKFDFYYYAPEDWEILSNHLDLPQSNIYNYDVTLPRHLQGIGVSPRFIANSDRATLGRVLFYDNNLSKDGTISCASCHRQEIAFSDDVAFSEGIESRRTARNSQPLGAVVNFAAYYGVDLFGSNAIQFFWDERAGTVMDQCRETFANPNEMGMTMPEVVAKVKSQPFYPILFKKAFHNGRIDEDNVLAALAEFVNSMGTFNSRYDQVFAQQPAGRLVIEDFTGFTEAENRGKKLYQENCATCHGATASRPAVLMAHNGLEIQNGDKGKANVTNRTSDEGVFKVHTLRNIALTAPYMHDGRFQTLEEVVEHYSSGIKSHPNLHNSLRINQQPKKMNFSADDKQALIAFLNTFTDQSFVTNVKFSDPFKR